MEKGRQNESMAEPAGKCAWHRQGLVKGSTKWRREHTGNVQVNVPRMLAKKTIGNPNRLQKEAQNEFMTGRSRRRAWGKRW